jgi:cytochrome d ubiquinol oxidase subunit II
VIHLYQLPLVFALTGLALYTVLGGADFGAGFWQLTAGRDEEGERVRDHVHHAMAPVWEANHVWLIFVLTVVWTAYPLAFGSLASTLAIPFFIAGIGIVLRGGAYAVRIGTTSLRQQRALDTTFSISCVLTPFALGTIVGGLASGRVHVGNPGGSVVTSWVNPTSIAIGVLTAVSCAYAAAVFLCGDAVRSGDRELAEHFRRRALWAGVVAGAVAVGALVVLHFDAERLFRRLVHGPGLPALIVSVAAGVTTLALVRSRRYEPARYTAAVAVAATIAGWALAQNPLFLSDLTVRRAAAPHDTLVSVTLAIVVGAIILFPSLALLFRLTLGGRLGDDTGVEGVPLAERSAAFGGRRLAARLAVAFLVAGAVLLGLADAGWAHALGAASLLGFVLAAYPISLPDEQADDVL